MIILIIIMVSSEGVLRCFNPVSLQARRHIVAAALRFTMWSAVQIVQQSEVQSTFFLYFSLETFSVETFCISLTHSRKLFYTKNDVFNIVQQGGGINPIFKN